MSLVLETVDRDSVITCLCGLNFWHLEHFEYLTNAQSIQVGYIPDPHISFK